jgi:hypothetical protein
MADTNDRTDGYASVVVAKPNLMVTASSKPNVHVLLETVILCRTMASHRERKTRKMMPSFGINLHPFR